VSTKYLALTTIEIPVTPGSEKKFEKVSLSTLPFRKGISRSILDK